ncbi:mechanosensitive ion channel family protein [Thalassomonas haliotis]|uniref:Small-conductance mechanosensitive channel n=1 Tax=Thalassomonas haliotis TaxID=485448 RepID=A0ABY7VJ58_9GAMM|nr:mechanosensitive ion channel domain-containing protein [Thalassomonas haliotis]WDE12968.1 mechanosensitive ion channel [Thalassomonas haliotis]
MFELPEMDTLMDSYILPWGINIVMALVIFILGRLLVKFIVSLTGKVFARSKMDAMLSNFLLVILNTILLLFVVVAALDQLGVDTTSLVALVGAAGLAIGLSLQGSLQNFAAGVMLLVFKPFRAGDFVETAGISGIVEEIHIFTTTICTTDNKEVIVPNGDIYGGNIINYSAKETRRVDMVFGTGYGDDLKKAKALLTDIVNNHPLILAEPAPTVALSELADSSVNFVVRPWVKTADYWTVKFEITETVKLRFDQEGISIPFPQMDLHMSKSA